MTNYLTVGYFVAHPETLSYYVNGWTEEFLDELRQIDGVLEVSSDEDVPTVTVVRVTNWSNVHPKIIDAALRLLGWDCETVEVLHLPIFQTLKDLDYYGPLKGIDTVMAHADKESAIAKLNTRADRAIEAIVNADYDDDERI
jgi:hypothetical protein